MIQFEFTFRRLKTQSGVRCLIASLQPYPLEYKDASPPNRKIAELRKFFTIHYPTFSISFRPFEMRASVSSLDYYGLMKITEAFKILEASLYCSEIFERCVTSLFVCAAS